jgi:hypothetical protein
MAVDCGLVACQEAKPGKEQELAEFLQKGRELAAAEDPDIRTTGILAVK